MSTISLRPHPDDSGRRLKVLQKLLKMGFPKDVLDVVGGKNLLNTKVEGEKECFSVTQSKYALFFQSFLHLGACPSFKPVHSEPSRLFCSGDPSLSPETIFQTMPEKTSPFPSFELLLQILFFFGWHPTNKLLLLPSHHLPALSSVKFLLINWKKKAGIDEMWSLLSCSAVAGF